MRAVLCTLGRGPFDYYINAPASQLITDLTAGKAVLVNQPIGHNEHIKGLHLFEATFTPPDSPTDNTLCLCGDGVVRIGSPDRYGRLDLTFEFLPNGVEYPEDARKWCADAEKIALPAVILCRHGITEDLDNDPYDRTAYYLVAATLEDLQKAKNLVFMQTPFRPTVFKTAGNERFITADHHCLRPAEYWEDPKHGELPGYREDGRLTETNLQVLNLAEKAQGFFASKLAKTW